MKNVLAASIETIAEIAHSMHIWAMIRLVSWPISYCISCEIVNALLLHRMTESHWNVSRHFAQISRKIICFSGKPYLKSELRKINYTLFSCRIEIIYSCQADSFVRTTLNRYCQRCSILESNVLISFQYEHWQINCKMSCRAIEKFLLSFRFFFFVITVHWIEKNIEQTKSHIQKIKNEREDEREKNQHKNEIENKATRDIKKCDGLFKTEKNKAIWP